jgi:PAS domain S-box-containing protein
VYGGAFVVLEWATVKLEALPTFVPWHPVAGVAFAVILLGGFRYLPATYTAAAVAGIAVWNLEPATTLLAALAFTCTYGGAVWVLRRAGFDARLARPRDVAALAGAALVASASVGLAGGASFLAGSSLRPGGFLHLARGWWLADALGILLLAPFACLWVERLRAGWLRGALREHRRSVRTAWLLAGAVLAPVLVWLGFDYGLREDLHLFYLSLVPVLLISLGYELAGASAAALALGIGMLVAAGHSPARPLDTQLFILATAVAALAFGTIVSERERARRALHDAQTSLDALVRASPVALVALDTQGRVVKWTPSAERLFGWPEKEVLGQPLPTVPESHEHEFNGVHAQLLRQGQAVSFETVRRRKDGMLIDVAVSAAPVRNADGAIAGHVAFITDITEQKASEYALRHRDAMLEAVGRASEEFLRSGHVLDEVDLFLADLGRAADVSRAWVFENHLDAEGRAVTSQRFEWCADHAVPRIGNPQLSCLSWDEEPQRTLRRPLEEGLACHVAPRDLDDRDARALLEAQGIRAMVAAPVFVDGEFWGVMGFDECRFERSWAQAETDALRAAAGIVGAALEAYRAARELTVSERRFRAMADSAPVLIWMTDTKGEPAFVNRTFIDFLGFSDGRSDDIWGRIHPDDRPAAQAAFYEALRSPTSYQREDRMLNASGEYRWLLTRVEPRFGSDGRLAGLTGVGVDVTESKQAEEALRESEERFRSAFDNAAVGMAIVALDGSLIRVNAELEKITGYASEELLTMRVNDVTHPDELEENRRNVRSLLAGERESFRQELRTIRKGGEALWVLLNVSLLRDENGRPLTFLAELQDISERKATEQERERLLAREREQVERLRDLDRAKDQFVATVSHELRTPLTNILGYLDILLDNADHEDERKLLQVVGRNASRLLRLVGDLLLVAQLSAGHLSLEPAPVRLDELAREALENAAPLAGERGVTLQAGADTAVELVADGVRLGQVVDNLILNAVKFTQPGGAVFVRTWSEGNHAYLEVEDTGIGIPEEDQPHLFRPFYRTQEAQHRAIQGTGLGLAIVKAIVEAHQGTVSVRSATGAGTAFTVQLPLRTIAGAAGTERRAA